MELCSKALCDIFEECAQKYEEAIAAENTLHEEIVAQLKSRAASCRVHGKESQDWLDSRAASVRGAIMNAANTMEVLLPSTKGTDE